MTYLRIDRFSRPQEFKYYPEYAVFCIQHSNLNSILICDINLCPITKLKHFSINKSLINMNKDLMHKILDSTLEEIYEEIPKIKVYPATQLFSEFCFDIVENTKYHSCYYHFRKYPLSLRATLLMSRSGCKYCQQLIRKFILMNSILNKIICTDVICEIMKDILEARKEDILQIQKEIF